MALMLPSTVEEINLLQNTSYYDFVSSTSYTKASNKGFENIVVEKQYKREYSLPNGVDWNINNYDPYLNFEDNLLAEELKAIESLEDRLVPEGDQRVRCESISSVASSMDDKAVVFQNLGVKTFNTVCMDSGSTCISSDHSYISSGGSIFKGLEAEETYQNLDVFLQQVPEMTINDNLPSPLSSTDSNFELSVLHNFSLHSGSQDGIDKPNSSKRRAETSSDDDIYSSNASKKLCESSPDTMVHTEVRRKNNIASKNCRKTRKEKQKEMEIRVSELEKEREGLKVEVQLLEEMIQRHKLQLYAILQKR